MYVWYFVRDGLEKGVKGHEQTALPSTFPDGIGGLGSTISDSGSDRRLSSAEITAETISSLGVQICTPSFSGMYGARSARRSSQLNSKSREHASAIGFEAPG